MDRRLDPAAQILLILGLILVFLRTLSIERARQFLGMGSRLMHEISIMTEKDSEFADDISVVKLDRRDAEEISDMNLAEDQLRSICNMVRWRKYAQARQRLIKLGFENPRISKRGDLILIYHDHGKLIIDSSNMRMLR